MPKETVYPLPSPDGTDADRRIEVGWSREQYVQIATTKLQPGADRNRGYIDGNGSPTEPLKHAWDGQWVALERWQINDLIRVLRKARDAAFGRDE